MVRSSTANKLSSINQSNHSNCIYNPARTTETDKNFSTGGRKGVPASLSVCKVEGFCSKFQVPCSELKKLRPGTKNTELGTNQSTAEAFWSCEVIMDTNIRTKDRKATKGGL